MIRYALFLLAVAGATIPAAAQVSWYAGIAGGQSKTDRELVANRESTITLATNISTAFDAKDTAWKAFAGLRFNPVLALELSYAERYASVGKPFAVGGSGTTGEADTDVVSLGVTMRF